LLEYDDDEAAWRPNELCTPAIGTADSDQIREVISNVVCNNNQFQVKLLRMGVYVLIVVIIIIIQELYAARSDNDE
jgi:hypothetical protein